MNLYAYSDHGWLYVGGEVGPRAISGVVRDEKHAGNLLIGSFRRKGEIFLVFLAEQEEDRPYVILATMRRSLTMLHHMPLTEARKVRQRQKVEAGS